MRHLDIVVPQRWFITEAKARIDHPEDLVFDEGTLGAKKALAAMIHAAEEPRSVSIKWDGSPAIIFGRDYSPGMVLTDKSGFNSKKPGGMPRSQAEVQQMLFMRKPTEPGRQVYADSIAKLYPLLDSAVPDDYKGYLQGDVLWTSKPQIINGNYVFKPNKITYSIPVDSLLGNKISNSIAGIVVHSEFDDQSVDDSRAIGNVSKLGLKDIAGLVIMGPEIHDLEVVHVPTNLKTAIETLIIKSKSEIDTFLDIDQLRAAKLSDLSSKLKQYLAQRASHGIRGVSDAKHGFVTWISSPESKLTENKRANMLDWISQHEHGYNALWTIVEQLVKLKDYIRSNVDKQVGNTIGAILHGQQGHEGYVADTPTAKIKLVDRPHFMRKE